MLGARGPEVSRIGLGTMSIMGAGDEAAVIRLVRAAIDGGITLIDTADVYGDGAVERVVGRALRGRRDDVVLATKVGLPMAGDRERSGGSARWIRAAVDDSLRRLSTDRIDLYQLHRPDLSTPIEETVAAFRELEQAGKIRFAGSSVFPPELIVEARWAAQRLDAEGFVSEQPPYSILVRGVEPGVLPTCRRHGVGVIVWGPLNGGWLTGKYRSDAPAPDGSRGALGNPFVRTDDVRKLQLVQQLDDVARAADMSLLELALSWPLHHPAVSSVLIGPRTEEQLAALLSAGAVSIEASVLDAVDAIVAPGLNVDPLNAGWAPPGLRLEERRIDEPG
jgi:aryl-alcohol dehydrogenase (NADP+)